MPLLRLYGLNLLLSRSVAGLVARPGAEPEDVTVAIGPLPDRWQTAPGPPSYVSPFLTDRDVPRAFGWSLDHGKVLKLAITGGPSFAVDARGTTVWADPSGCSDEELSMYLVGPVLGLVLRRRGIVCLHASAVEVGGIAIAFAGREGAGKSTLAAALVGAGAAIVTDDLAALAVTGDEFAVQTGLPVARVRRGATSGPFYDVHGRAPDPAGLPVPLGIIYCIDSAGHARRRPVSFENMAGAAPFMALAGDTWATRWMTPAERAIEFDVLAELVLHIPIRRLALTEDPGGDGAVVEAVLADAQRMARRSRSAAV